MLSHIIEMIVFFCYAWCTLNQWKSTMKKLVLGALVLLLPMLLMAQGSTYKIGSTIRINKSDSIANNVIAAGQFVDVYGHLGDDLFAVARNLVINGHISDDAIVAGRSVTVTGSVGDMLVAAGETVLIDGEVNGDLFAAGAEVRIAPTAHIHGNAALAGNRVIFEGGTIDGWMRVSGADVKLNGSVGNYVELYGNNFTFGDNYRPQSGTTITATEELDADEMGKPPEDLQIVVDKENMWGAAFFVSIWFYVSLLITGILLMLIFKQTTIDMHRFSTEHYFKNTGVGLLLFIVVPIAVIVTLILILTIPLSIILLILYGLSLFTGYLLVAVTLGTVSIRFFKTQEDFSDYLWGLALGIIIILLLSIIPFVGWVINLLLIFFGLGTLISYFWEMRENRI